jgi:hypothetical protein
VGLQITYRSNQLQPCPYSPICVILVCLRITEVNQDPVAHVLRYEAAEALHRLCNAFLIGGNDLTEVFWVHAGREGRRAHEVREHNRDLTALCSILSW